MKKEQRKQLYALLEQWTRCEIIARIGKFGFPEYADYHMEMIEKEKEIRKLLYGTADFIELGRRWNLPLIEDSPKEKRRKKIRTKKKKDKKKKKKKRRTLT